MGEMYVRLFYKIMKPPRIVRMYKREEILGLKIETGVGQKKNSRYEFSTYR